MVIKLRTHSRKILVEAPTPRTPPDSPPPSRGESEPRVTGWPQAPPSRGTSGPPPFLCVLFSFFPPAVRIRKKRRELLVVLLLAMAMSSLLSGREVAGL